MLSQPLLFTASLEERKQVRDLLNRFARLIAKENGIDEKVCTCHVRKFVNRQSKPKMMTAYKQFMLDNSADINDNTKSFTEFNEEKTRRWNAVKQDKDQLTEYERRATEFNEEHGLLKKKKKRALTGYMLFSNEQRPIIKEEDPSLTLSEVSKRIGKLWNSLEKKEKETWVQKSKDLSLSSTEEVETPSTEETETPVATPKSKKSSSKTKKSKKNKE